MVDPHRTRGTNVGVADSFQLSQIHYHVLILKLQRSYIQLKCNKNVMSQKAQVHVRILFCNSDSHEFPQCHQRSSKSNNIGEIVSLMKKRKLGAFKTNLKNSKSKGKGSRSRSQSMNEQSRYKQEKTKTIQKKAKLTSQIKITSNKNVNIGEIEVDLNIGGDY
ncbi:hypothetical protein Tco_0448148 [Tanacetum coccineum]